MELGEAAEGHRRVTGLEGREPVGLGWSAAGDGVS